MKCLYCGQEMTDPQAVTCSGNKTLELPGGTFETLAFLPLDPYEKCQDCGISSGGKHHPGCDLERCPACGGQLNSCGCQDEYPDESADWQMYEEG